MDTHDLESSQPGRRAGLPLAWWLPVAACVAILLATQIRWLVRHGYWPTAPLRFSLAIGLGVVLGLGAWLALRGALRRGLLAPERQDTISRLLLAVTLVAPGAWVDPVFPGLTLAVMLLAAGWVLERPGGAIRAWVSGLATPTPTPRAAAGVTILVAAAAAVALRAPELLTMPRIWAEDGTHTLSAMHQLRGLDALLWHHEYYRLFSNIAGWLATRAMSLEQAPIAFTLVAFTVKMFVFLLVVTGRSPLWDTTARKLATVAVILFTPHSNEIWLNVNGSHFYLALLAALLLVEIGQPASTLRRWILRGALVATSLGGALPCLLAPLFWLRALHTRNRDLYIAAGIVSAAAVLQALAIQAFEEPVPRGTAASASMAGWIILIKHGALLIDDALARSAFAASRVVFVETGFPTTGHWLLAAALTFLALLAWRLRSSPALYLLGSAVVLTLSTLLFGIGGAEQAVFRHPYLGSRYFYVPSVLLVLAVLAAITLRPRIAGILPSAAVALVVLGLLTGNGYRSGLDRSPWADGNPVWQDEIARWRQNPYYQPQVWPERFRIDMNREW